MFEELAHIARKANFKRALDNAIKETEFELLELLRAQLSKGQGGDGTLPALNDYYYARKKKKMGGQAPFGIMDLKFKGDFYDSLQVQKSNNVLYVGATDPKTPKLIEIAGEQIFELNAENFEYYKNEILLPAIIKYVENELRI